jgi:hypothetical protein
MSDTHASASAPAEDEPKTPMWLPGLGAALFVSVGLWWAVTPGAPPPVTDQPAATASAAPPATVAPRPQPMPVPAGAQIQPPMPLGSAAMPGRKVIPGNGPLGLPQPNQGARPQPRQ